MDVDLATLAAEVTSALGGLDARQTQATPPEAMDKWNIQQIVEHLLITLRGSAAAVQVRLEKGSPLRSSATLIQTAKQWLVLGGGLYPYGRKAPAAVSPTLPTALKAGEDLAQRMHAALAQFDIVSAEAERILGSGRTATHTTLGPLTMRQWRRLHLVHGRHHLRQIWRIREARGI